MMIPLDNFMSTGHRLLSQTACQLKATGGTANGLTVHNSNDTVHTSGLEQEEIPKS
jgi:hypothetical protein